jgi:hypothetical protein
MLGAVSALSLCYALLQKPTKALLTQTSAELDPHCREGVISLDMTACCQKDCGSCADDSDVCLANATNGRATTCCPSAVVQQGDCETSKAPCAVPAYVRETPDVSELRSAEGVPNAADDCGEAIADTEASILVATHFLLFPGKEPSGAAIHDTVTGSGSTTTKCGELGDTVAVAAATCDKENDCMGFTASDGVPDCLLVAGIVVEGYKSSSKDTYLKQMGSAEFTYMFDPPGYEEDSCSEECGGGVLNRVMGCKTSANTTVKGGMCSHIAWMNKDSLPDEQIPCNTFDCGPPPALNFVTLKNDGVCIDKDGVPIVKDRAYNCGSGLDKYQIAITQKSFPRVTDPATTQVMMESADGPCMGTYQGFVCRFVPGCYYNFYTSPSTGLGSDGRHYHIRFDIQTEHGGWGRFYANGDPQLTRKDMCVYVRGPGETKVGLSDQNVGEFPTFGPKDGWIMNNKKYNSADMEYYYYYYHKSMLQTEEEEKIRSHPINDLPTVKISTNNTVVHNRSDAIVRLFTSFNTTKLQRNGKDLIAVMKNMRDRNEALFVSNNAKMEAYKKMKAEKKGKKSKACSSGKGNQKGKILHLKSK